MFIFGVVLGVELVVVGAGADVGALFGGGGGGVPAGSALTVSRLLTSSAPGQC